jgi:hypothetical protein
MTVRTMVGRPVPLQKWSTVDPADLLSKGGLSESAEKSWHRLDGHNQLPKTILRSKLAAARSNASVRCRKIRLLPTDFRNNPPDIDGSPRPRPFRIKSLASITVPEKTTFNVRLDSARR